MALLYMSRNYYYFFSLSFVLHCGLRDLAQYAQTIQQKEFRKYQC